MIHKHLLLAQQLKLPNTTPGAPDVIVEGPLRPELVQAGIGGIITMLLSFLYAVAIVLLFFIFIWGGYDILTSQGSEEQFSAGAKKISSGVIGFILLILALFVTRIVAFVFGLDTSLIF
ncbi:MAG: hypothetical protein UZ22_OP11002000135 [Microgenomates bacterium OLB23]|nr:MAG: hypothetical protein UZ22_OP11002000135 [Microgenomates bacterium OLB23]